MRTPVLATLLATHVIAASAVSLDVTATTISHQFEPAARSTVDTILGSFWGAAPVPSFTTNLSSASEFSLTVSAPSGYEFLVRPAPNSVGLVLSFGSPLSMWIASGWNGGVRDFMPTSVSFSGFAGPSWYDDTTGVTVDQDGRALMAEGALWWTGSPELRFKSVTLSADLSSLHRRGYSAGTFSPDLAVGIKLQDVLAAGARTDPGPAIVLVSAVPETSSSVLLALGIGCLAVAIPSRRRDKFEQS